MIESYIKIAWRNLIKSKIFSAVNILGLAAGLASFIIILLYLNYELSYDKWNPELKKVYKVSIYEKGDYLPQSYAPLASFLVQNYPDAAAGTAVQGGMDFDVLLATNDKKIFQKGFVTVDSSFLKVFPYKIVRGDAKTALDKPDATVITEDLAHKLFGNSDPIGKTIKVFNAITGTVTAIMQQPKTPTHFNAQIIMRSSFKEQYKNWGNQSYQTYIKLKQPITEAKLENDINRLYYNERLKKGNLSFEDYKKAGQKSFLYTDAVSAIHNFPKHGESNFTTVSILLILAVLLLLAGTINFSNLAIAKSIGRAKEVGVRKVLGSDRKQLVLQFMSETALQCVISLGVAVFIVLFSLKFINQAFNLSLSFWHQNNTASIFMQIALCLLLVILLSGLYPSLIVARFNTAKVLKGNYSSGNKGTFFRNGLIVVQFMVSAFFVIAVLVIKSQMHYMQTKDKGFSAEQVMRIEAPQKIREEGFSNLQNILSSVAGVSMVAQTTNVPGDQKEMADTSTFNFKHAGKEYRMASVKISTDYFKTLKIAVKQGRLFNDSYTDQNTRSAVINETAFQKFHDENLLGKTIAFAGCDSIRVKIVGVVKDFNVQGFESAVQPVVYTIGNKACMYQSGGGILVKLNSNHIQQTVAAIELAWKKVDPDSPIRYSFLDNNFQQLFLSYSRLQSLITFFAVIAILISVMGLFALTAFFTKQRTKEIGVRKVLGATVTQLAALLSKEFVYLVILSVLLISPLAWWVMNRWLQTFVYRISINWWMFMASGFLVLFIALLTISFQAIKAALANPVKSLRSE
ncbi:MAG: ABC transporter permease [Janthinobacterium lividum]